MLTPVNLDKKGNRYIRVIQEPSVEPVTLSELKTFARLDGEDENDLLEEFITASRDQIEKYLNLSLISKKLEIYMDQWNTRDLVMPYSPVISLDSIKEIQEDGTETEVDTDIYFILETIPSRIAINDNESMPYSDARSIAGYKIQYTAGYGTAASDVPIVIKIAIMQYATDMYENRVMNGELPMKVKNILGKYKVHNT